MEDDERRELVDALITEATAACGYRVAWNDLLQKQNDSILGQVKAETRDWSVLYWQAFDIAIHAYRNEYDERLLPYPHWDPEVLPDEDFFFSLAVALVPLMVERNLPELDSPPVLDWDGKYSGNDIESLCGLVSAELEGMWDSIYPSQKSLRLCRGYYLNGNYGGALLPEEEFQWLHDHALEVLPVVDDIFRGSKFDLRFARDYMAESTPLRGGTL